MYSKNTQAVPFSLVAMSSNFKYNLSKALKKYAKYIPQLSKPVLRVLIQGTHRVKCNNTHF